MLKNLYVPKKSNENKKEEAATCDTTWQAAVALSLSLSLSLIITVTPQANPHPQASPSIPPPQFFPYFSFILFSEIPLNQFTQHTDIFLIQSWKNPIFHFYLFIHQVFYFLLESRISFFLLLFFLLYYTIESGFLKEGSF
jgi:hypothetical protein